MSIFTYLMSALTQNKFDSTFGSLVEFKQKRLLPIDPKISRKIDINLEAIATNFIESLQSGMLKQVKGLILQSKDKEVPLLKAFDKISFIPLLNQQLQLLWVWSWRLGKDDGLLASSKILNIDSAARRDCYSENNLFASFASEDYNPDLEAKLRKIEELQEKVAKTDSILRDRSRRESRVTKKILESNPQITKKQFKEIFLQEEDNYIFEQNRIKSRRLFAIEDLKNKIKGEGLDPEKLLAQRVRNKNKEGNVSLQPIKRKTVDRTEKRGERRITRGTPSQREAAAEIVARKDKEKLINTETGVDPLSETSFGKTYLNQRLDYIAYNTNLLAQEFFRKPIESYFDPKNQGARYGGNKELKLIRDLDRIYKTNIDTSQQQKSLIAGLKQDRYTLEEMEALAKQNPDKQEFYLSRVNSKRKEFDLSPEQQKLLGVDKSRITLAELNNLREGLTTYELLTNRLKRIGITEVTHAYNLGRLASFFREGVEFVQWVTEIEKDPCLYCKQRHGVIVPITKVIDIPKKQASFRDKDLWVIPSHPFCRCYWKPVRGDKNKSLVPGGMLVPATGAAVTTGILAAYPMYDAFREYILNKLAEEKQEDYNRGRLLGLTVGAISIPIAAYAISRRVQDFFAARNIINLVSDAFKNVSQDAVGRIISYTQADIDNIRETLSSEAAAAVLEGIAQIVADELSLQPNEIEIINRIIAGDTPNENIRQVLTDEGIDPERASEISRVITTARQSQEESRSATAQTAIVTPLPRIRIQSRQEEILTRDELIYIRNNLLTRRSSRQSLDLLPKNQNITPSVIRSAVSEEEQSILDIYFRGARTGTTARRSQVLDEIRQRANIVAEGISVKPNRSVEQISADAKRLIREGRTSILQSPTKSAKVVLEEVKPLDKKIRDAHKKIKQERKYRDDLESYLNEIGNTNSSARYRELLQIIVREETLMTTDTQKQVEDVLKLLGSTLQALETENQKITAAITEVESWLNKRDLLLMEINSVLGFGNISSLDKNDLDKVKISLTYINPPLKDLREKIGKIYLYKQELEKDKVALNPGRDAILRSRVQYFIDLTNFRPMQFQYNDNLAKFSKKLQAFLLREVGKKYRLVFEG